MSLEDEHVNTGANIISVDKLTVRKVDRAFAIQQLFGILRIEYFILLVQDVHEFVSIRQELIRPLGHPFCKCSVSSGCPRESFDLRSSSTETECQKGFILSLPRNGAN